MKQVEVFILLSLFYFVTLARQHPRSVATVRTQKDVSDSVNDRSQGHFNKPSLKKHLLPGLGTNTGSNVTSVKPQRILHVVDTTDKDKTSIVRPSQSRNDRSDPSLPVCSAQTYRVRLRNGNCTRQVSTKVCLVLCLMVL